MPVNLIKPNKRTQVSPELQKSLGKCLRARSYPRCVECTRRQENEFKGLYVLLRSVRAVPSASHTSARSPRGSPRRGSMNGRTRFTDAETKARGGKTACLQPRGRNGTELRLATVLPVPVLLTATPHYGETPKQLPAPLRTEIPLSTVKIYCKCVPLFSLKFFATQPAHAQFLRDSPATRTRPTEGKDQPLSQSSNWDRAGHTPPPGRYSLPNRTART